ncbi:ATP-binding protein [Cryobacterium tagatosivorans]|uniref:histidine kinase n=1 Tax=Cryobacterium tagatosivorans TaxID=1259199 RepID=A0A4R8UFD8_9MICO|nr:ATP-binding protein [Cryobacterium tagatosivorans]TFB50264.1 HAMP domain-containing protein [Cryobacterium tagatosivorans]
MIDLRRRRAAQGRPIAARLRRFVYVLWALLLLVCVTAVGALQIQTNEVNRLTLALGPAVDANGHVLHFMSDAETELLGYELSHDPERLTHYRADRARTMAALATLQDPLALLVGDLNAADHALHTGLEGAQRLAVEQWWVYARNTEQAVLRGDRTDLRRGHALSDNFRRVNAALGEHLTTERDEARSSAQATAAAGTTATIAASLAALVATFVLGQRAARSMSRPIAELRDTVTRQREGEPGARAREDQGSLEIRSLAADFNALTEQNLGLQQTQARALRMHQLTFEVERAIRTAPDTQQALDVLCAALGEGLGADRVMANTVDADHKVLLGAQWHLPDLPPLGDMPDDLVPHVGGLAEELWLAEGFAARDDFLAPEVQSRERSRIFHRATGARAVIMVPIGLGDRVIGAIYVLMVHEPRRWTASETGAVQQVAAFVARVIVEADYRAHQSEYVERIERLDRQKTDFLSTVSHELRTPLTSISGYLELLQDGDAGELTGEQHRMLEVIDRNTSRLRGLIEDLLVINRIESGGLKVNVTPVSMRELITHTGQELSPLAQSGAIELDIDAGPDEAIVQGDRGHLQRSIVNIVSNAIKFSRPGGVVTIRCTLDQGAQRVLFTCQDRGIGIPADDQAKIFTRFYRASNATAQAIPGTGLGLAIVKQIVEDHGGELRLTSVEGEGTTVVMDLPLSGSAH